MTVAFILLGTLFLLGGSLLDDMYPPDDSEL